MVLLRFRLQKKSPERFTETDKMKAEYGQRAPSVSVSKVEHKRAFKQTFSSVVLMRRISLQCFQV